MLNAAERDYLYSSPELLRIPIIKKRCSWLSLAMPDTQKLKQVTFNKLLPYGAKKAPNIWFDLIVVLGVIKKIYSENLERSA